MNILLLILYRIIVVPITIVIVMPLLFMFNEKFRRGMQMRSKRREWPQFSEQPIWVHASSGEFEYAKPLLRELKAANASCPLLVTWFSPTFAKSIEKSNEVDCTWPLPLDLPGPISQFIGRMKPRALVIARTDLWPELLHQCREHHIPAILFSARQNPVPLWNILKQILLRWNYSRLNSIYCVSEADAIEIRKLAGRTPVYVAGDTRYDQVHFRLQHAKPLNEKLKPSGLPPVIVAGSTWSQDEIKLIAGLGTLLRERQLKMILVPHEPTEDHIGSLKSQLDKAKIPFSLYSQAESWDTSVLLVDRVGLLAELYQWGQIAFVGGSFKRTVHSVMEPLAAGLPVLVGPYYSNNREAIEFSHLKFNGFPLVIPCVNANQLAARAQELIQGSADWTALRHEVSNQVKRRMGATRRISENILSLPVAPS